MPDVGYIWTTTISYIAVGVPLSHRLLLFYEVTHIVSASGFIALRWKLPQEEQAHQMENGPAKGEHQPSPTMSRAALGEFSPRTASSDLVAFLRLAAQKDKVRTLAGVRAARL